MFIANYSWRYQTLYIIMFSSVFFSSASKFILIIFNVIPLGNVMVQSGHCLALQVEDNAKVGPSRYHSAHFKNQNIDS